MGPVLACRLGRSASAALLMSILAATGCSKPAAQAAVVVHGINGSWEGYPSRAEGLGSGAANTRPGPPPIPDPPLKPEHLEAWKAERTRNAELTRKGLPPVTSGMACLPEGMPAMMQATFPMEVLETPGQVTIVQEAFTQVRRIHLGEKLPPVDDVEPTFSGRSVGRWEGDTLVVETIGVKEYARFRNTPHSANMRITERIRLVEENIFEDRVTVEDPEYLTGPWTWTWMYRRWPGYKIQEYVCEDNRYVEDPELRYQRLRVK